jgi:hypothetical protein
MAESDKPKRVDYAQLADELERLVDANTLERVLDCLATDVCLGKSERIRANWQDKSLADAWDTLADRLEKVRVAAEIRKL